MKILMMMLTMFFGLFARAEVIEVNDLEGKVFFSPTPTLQMTVVDLDDAGGLMTVFLDYKSKDAKDEFATLGERYPDYQVQAVALAPVDAEADFQISDLDLAMRLKVQQGQSGPYLNGQIMLTQAQMKKVKDLKSSLISRVRFKLPVRGQYVSKRVLEQISISSSVCGSGRVRNVQDVSLYLADLKKPEAIHYPQTFAALKQEILKKCFSMGPASIQSFAAMIQLPIIVNSDVTLNAKYSESVPQDYNGNLKVKNSLEFN